MRRFVLISVMASGLACVNLDKPPQVADCAMNGTCVNGKSDAAIGQIDVPSAPDQPVADGGGAPPEVIDSGVPSDTPPQSLLDGPENDVTTAGTDDAAAARDLAAPDVLPGACSVAGLPKPAGTICRVAVDLCDVAEVCDGVSLECPADKPAAAATPCRPVAGDCDIAETCDGTSTACPVDGFKAAGTVCRVAAGVCDVAESCEGTSPACPVDSLAPSTTVCRTSTDTNHCDPAENCTGTSVACPADTKYAKPAVPTAVTATGGSLQVTVAWTASAGATGYNVKQALASKGSYTTLVGSPTTTASPYTDTGLAGLTTYYYVVSAIDTIPSCQSDDSAEASAKTQGTCVAPTAPSITATPANGIVTVSWAAVTGAVSYTVARSQSTGTGYITVGTVKTGTTFTDSNVVNGATYYYVVTASNGTCSSVNSNEASTSPACTPPAAPTGLGATGSNGSVTLKWTASSTAISYSIYRNTTGSDSFTFVNSTTQLTFTDSNVVNDTKYYYVVRASNGSCASGNSVVVQVTPACVPPKAPTGVLVTVGDKQLGLSWTAPSGATQYRVSRNTTGTGSFAEVGTPTTTNFTDKPLSNGTTYYYVVAASNGSCWSADSAVASGTPACTPPPIPGSLTTTPGDGQVSLSWGASQGATVYTIWRKTGSDGTYASLGTATSTTYLDKTAVNGTTYYYQVDAGNGSCASTPDAEQAATPVPACGQAAPANVVATASGSVQVTLTWAAATPTPTTYGIARSTTSGTGYASIGSVAGSVLTYTDTDTTLIKNTPYYYEVTANGSCTASSAEVSATTACTNPAKPSPTTVGNSDGSITVQWAAVSGATAYAVSRSSDGTSYTVVSPAPPPPLTATSYNDPANGLTNGAMYYYKVTASNANAQCSTESDATTAARSCIIPSAPGGLKAMRTGNKQVTLVWTASSGTNLSYRIQRAATTSYATTASTSYVDNAADNATAFSYTVSALSDAGGNCSSAPSTAGSVSACTVLGAGTHSAQLSNTTTEWCVVSCNDVSTGSGFAEGFNCGSRTFYLNGAQQTCGPNINTPAKSNGGYAYYFTAASDGGYVGAQWGNGTSAACP